MKQLSISNQSSQEKVKRKRTTCKECRRTRECIEKHEICHVCYNINKILKPKTSGNKVIDDFIRYTQTNYVDKDGKMEFAPYEQFENIEFIASGGFSKIYKATWVDGPINNWCNIKRYTYSISRSHNCTVVLKTLNDLNNITSNDLNELKLYYQIFTENYKSNGVSKYLGITLDPKTKEIMIIMPYYESDGLAILHKLGIVHRDLHSGNIFFDKYDVVIGDLGISKSAIESDNDDNEIYGIIPYMAPEIFHRQKYTTASDIYSFGMIMWEFMTGRRPFWNKTHDSELIIRICDGLRPPVVTNAPEGYVELMKECWDPVPKERPTAAEIYNKIKKIKYEENQNPTKINVESADIGPAVINSQETIYNSRSLSKMIQSAMSSRSSRSLSIDSELDPFYYYQRNSTASSTDKRKFENDSVEDDHNEQSIKKSKLLENHDSFTRETELDVRKQSCNNEYITKEFDLDINL
ncbi:kinase-like domain-containing protein [Rhizophagus clarus]|uniref:Kinase-like domain-containing protein n=1 Tax=Rhizophagus clarus TaxID=94130 RepID=A0A8H3LMD1_9GLOM|nr:kinase-like domain-containing protein [Rhizophagus clarus]